MEQDSLAIKENMEQEKEALRRRMEEEAAALTQRLEEENQVRITHNDLDATQDHCVIMWKISG